MLRCSKRLDLASDPRHAPPSAWSATAGSPSANTIEKTLRGRGGDHGCGAERGAAACRPPISRVPPRAGEHPGRLRADSAGDDPASREPEPAVRRISPPPHSANLDVVVGAGEKGLVPEGEVRIAVDGRSRRAPPATASNSPATSQQPHLPLRSRRARLLARMFTADGSGSRDVHGARRSPCGPGISAGSRPPAAASDGWCRRRGTRCPRRGGCSRNRRARAPRCRCPR